MFTVRTNIKSQLIGRALAVLFGLLLLMEMGVLPYFSSVANDFEHSLVAELTDLEGKEKAEEYQPDFDHLLHDVIHLSISEPSLQGGSPLFSALTDEHGGNKGAEIFLLHRQFRL